MGFGAKVTAGAITAALGFSVASHETRHLDGGDDQITSGDLIAGADPRSSLHASRHASGGADYLDVGSIGGAPLVHASRHFTGGADAIAPDSIGAAALVHASRHATGGADELAPDSIGAVDLDSQQTVSGLKVFTTAPMVTANPTVDSEVARKAYVDAAGYLQWQRNWGTVENPGHVSSELSFASDQVYAQIRDPDDDFRVFASNITPYSWKSALGFRTRGYRGTAATRVPTMWAVITVGGSDINGTPTQVGFGWKVIDDHVYSWSADGTAQEATDLTVKYGGGVVGLSQAQWLEARLYPGTRVEFYVDGILREVHTTRVPTLGQATTGTFVFQFHGQAQSDPGNPRTVYFRSPEIFAIDRGTRTLMGEEGLANGEWSGDVAFFVAGENLAQYEVGFRNSNGNIHRADADADSTVPGMYMALQAITSGNDGIFLVRGFVRNTSWAWGPGSLLYADTVPGGITMTPPVGSGDQVQRLGVAEDSFTAYFTPSLTVVEVV